MISNRCFYGNPQGAIFRSAVVLHRWFMPPWLRSAIALYLPDGDQKCLVASASHTYFSTVQATLKKIKHFFLQMEPWQFCTYATLYLYRHNGVHWSLCPRYSLRSLPFVYLRCKAQTQCAQSLLFYSILVFSFVAQGHIQMAVKWSHFSIHILDTSPGSPAV